LKQYTIVTQNKERESRAIFESRIEDNLNDGWILHGQLLLAADGTLMQAMTRSVPNRQDSK